MSATGVPVGGTSAAGVQLPVPVGLTQAQADAINQAQQALAAALNKANGFSDSVTNFNLEAGLSAAPGTTASTAAVSTVAGVVSLTIAGIESAIAAAIATYDAAVAAAKATRDAAIAAAVSQAAGSTPAPAQPQGGAL